MGSQQGDDLQLNGDLGCANAEIRAVLTVAFAEIRVVLFDPSVTGLAAPLGSLALRATAPFGAWQKTSNPDNGWTTLGGGGAGTDQAFVYTASGAEANPFVVALPAARASANYIVEATMGVNSTGIAPSAITLKTINDFTIEMTAGIALNDTINFLVKDFAP